MILLDRIPSPGQLIMPALTLAINLSFFQTWVVSDVWMMAQKKCSSLGPGFTQVVLESFTLVDRAAHWNGTTDGCTLRAEPADPVDIHAWGHSLHEYSWTGRRQPSGCQGGCIRVGVQQSLPWQGSPLAAQPAASAHLWDESSWWCWFSWSTLVWF